MKTTPMLLSLLTLSALPAMAEVRLPHVLSDHAVLQRDHPIHLWGWAAPQEKVSVKFHDQSGVVKADEFGAWELWLKPESAGGPYTLQVEGSETHEALKRVDLLMGDVWIASGQSNMEMPLQGFTPEMRVKNDTQEMANAKHPEIRLLLQHRRTTPVAAMDTDDTWTLCLPETARKFSAVAYFFGREIAKDEKVPIGLIDISWGGTPVQAWISPAGIASANLPSVYIDGGQITREQGYANGLRTNLEAQNAIRKQQGQPPLAFGIPNDHGSAWIPGALFNGMISPYTPFQIKGFLWYQGENDTSPNRAPFYARTFPALIQDWRKQWAEGTLPFLYVQISSFAHDPFWGMVRDAQRRTLELDSTGMAVSLDLGAENNVHPPDKQTVAYRLELAAEAIAYGKGGEYVSPSFVQAAPEGASIRVLFSHAEGLTSKGQPLGNFEVAGADRRFVPATAQIDGKAVTVGSPAVAAPKYVRYGWTGTVTSYLYNAAGLPLGSFTSEP